MKGKGIMVANKDWYDGYERTFGKKCPGCREIESYFKIKPDEISSCECMDCGKVLKNENHRGE